MFALYERLAPREKLMALVGIAFIILFILYELVCAPINNHIDYLKQQVADNQQLLTWMQARASRIQMLKSAAQTSTKIAPQALPGTVDTSMHRLQLTNSNIQQNSDQSVTVQFKSVPFDLLTQWMISIVHSYGINITAVSVTRLPAPGMVTAKVTVKNT